MPQGLYNAITRFFYLAFAILNALRLIFDWQVMVGDYEVTRGTSVIILFVSAMLTNSVKKSKK